MILTLLLIFLNVVVFFYTYPNLPFYINGYGFEPVSFLGGRYHTILTSLFLHANEIHLIFNMISLFLLAPSVEKKVGALKFYFVYFFGGMIANLATFIPFFYKPGIPGIGASGAISALIGLGTFLCPGKLVISQFLIPLPFVVVGAFYFLSNALNLFIPSNIGYHVHMVGLIFGSFFGLIWSKNWIKGILIFIIVLILIMSLPYILSMVLEML
ncbi:MAG: rhomboid family intramembrane serine protease [Candidatus Aenigmarchaeota archaeon]|nr:rhomboid family intramembrane serine protease [Candidatus Aenigmarchaeota archaeon]